MTTKRVYNFSPGPATLPLPVLEEAQRDLVALPGYGVSILETGHRTEPFTSIIREAEANIRRLLGVSADYHVLFLQGGSRLQFSMIPQNLLRGTDRPADYILTGSWGKYAAAEARHEGRVRVAWDGKPHQYDRLPDAGQLDLDPQAAYVHFTINETIEGVQFAAEPEVGDVPLVCDASSEFLSRPLDVSRYGLIYACAQKNAGPAGVTIVIIRKDLAERGGDALGGMLNYKTHVENQSLYNTPPVFAVYITNLITRWLLNEVGGLEEMDRRNRRKAALLYEAIDAGDGFYEGHARPACRSLMNATFRLPSEELTGRFIREAEQQGLYALAGHRSVGGIRASIYNAMPEDGVRQLAAFMREFHEQHAAD
jgi:phosphoserine aminotransferase